jgi:anti-sigma regulatory factor (Ser/Thr protein kinase)
MSESHTLDVTPGLPLPAVREYLRSVDGHLPDQVRERLALLVTEVVSNATGHGKPPVSLEATWLAGTARVVVRSGGSPFHWRGRPASPLEDGGWGLVFVDVLADRWGIHSSSSQNTVWFEIDH